MKFKKGSKHAFDPNKFLASRATRGTLRMGDIMKIASRPGELDIVKMVSDIHKPKAPK
jgi:hypothetical protein